MSQRDLVAELRAARVQAPAPVRERVRVIAGSGPERVHRIAWRRAIVVAVPVAAALAAAVVLTRPSTHETTPAADNGSVGAAVQHAAGRVSTQPLATPPIRGRVASVGETLSLRVRDISSTVKRAVQVASVLGGYATSVRASTAGGRGTADLTLKVPRAHVQEAVTRLAQLGTITAEHLELTDRQAGLNATDRLITRLQRRLAALREQNAPAAQIAAVTKRIQALQRAEAATRRSAHYATLRLHLATPTSPVHKRHHGPLHGVAVALEWLGIGAVYALALGLPVAIVLALLWLATRVVRRRREDALLSRQ